jgi:hypothetical protein
MKKDGVEFIGDVVRRTVREDVECKACERVEN